MSHESLLQQRSSVKLFSAQCQTILKRINFNCLNCFKECSSAGRRRSWHSLDRLGYLLQLPKTSEDNQSLFSLIKNSLLNRQISLSSDHFIFMAMQINRYLHQKGSFGSCCERMMIYQLIEDNYRQLPAHVAHLNEEYKLYYFRLQNISFPVKKSLLYKPIVVNFQTGRRYRNDEPCPCGSGLNYGHCCNLD